MIIDQLFTSPGHNYFGHHERPPADFPLVASDSIECVSGRGIRGDRFFDYRHDYKGQITFFSGEISRKWREPSQSPINHPACSGAT